MTDYAQITTGAITAVGQPPPVVRLADGNWVDLRQFDPSNLAAAGWVAVVETDKPEDTNTDTWTGAVTLVAGVPTRTWTAVPKPPIVPTADEKLAALLAALADAETLGDVRAAAQTAGGA